MHGRTMQSTGPGLALLAPAGDRGRESAMEGSHGPAPSGLGRNIEGYR